MADQSIKNVTNIAVLQSGDKIPVGRAGNNQALVIQGSQLLKTASDLSEINTPTKKQNARDNLDVYSTTEVDLAITNEATARSNADNSLDARLDIVEGANTVVGSIAKAEKDAKDFSIQRVNHTGTQLSSTISDFSEATQDVIGGILTDTATIDFSYDDSLNTITADVKDNSISNIKITTGIDAGKIADGSISNTEFQYLNNLSSNIQDQFDTKTPTQLNLLQRFVSPQGNDTLNGQIDRKKLTIENALTSLDGQSSADVDCEAGTYAETLTFGTSRSRRTLRGVLGGERSIITRTLTFNENCQQSAIRNFKFEVTSGNGGGFAISITSTLSNFVFDNLTCGGNHANSIFLNVASGGSGFITITNCDLNNKIINLANTSTPRFLFINNSANLIINAGTGWIVVKGLNCANVLEASSNNNILEGWIANSVISNSTEYNAIVGLGSSADGYYLCNYTNSGVFSTGDVILRQSPLTVVDHKHYNANAVYYVIGTQKTYFKKAGSWVEMQASLGYTAENQANKENTILDTSTTKYPTNNLVKTSIDAKVEDQITDGVTTKAPSQNAVFDALALKLDTSLKGANNGLAELGSDGKVPSSQLPAYVDDVLEYTDFASFPVTGETGKIYIALDTNITYRWSGSVYVVIGSSLALGETSSTAYRGDRGKIAYDHSQLTSGNPHNVTKSDVGLGNVDNTSDLDKPISTATQDALDLKQDSYKQTILQINHGFTVGKVVRQNTNGIFSLAQADSEANSRACGFIIEVINTSTFVIATNGSLSLLEYSVLTSAIATQLGYANWLQVPTGKTYYLSPTTAGNITETKPTTTGQYVIPVFRKVFGESDNIDILLPTIDNPISDSGGGGGGDSTVAVNRIINTSTNKSDLSAGTYITQYPFADGMPSGIEVNDIFSKDISNNYTLVSSYANASTNVKVGSTGNEVIYQRVAGTWQPTSVSVLYNEDIDAGDLVKLNSDNKLEKIVTNITGASTDIITTSSAQEIVSQTTPYFIQHKIIDADKIVLVTRQPTSGSGAVQITIGVISGTTITWGNPYTTQSSLQFMCLSICRMRDGYFAVQTGAGGSSAVSVCLFQYSLEAVPSIIAEKLLQSTNNSYASETGHMAYVGEDMLAHIYDYNTTATVVRKCTIIKITNFDGANTTFLVNATDINFGNYANTTYGGTVKVYGESVGVNQVRVLFMSVRNGFVRYCARTSTYNTGNNTITHGTENNFDENIGTQCVIKGIAQGPTSLSVALLRWSNTGTVVNSYTCYHYITFINFATTPAVLTSFGANYLSNPVPVPFTGSSVASCVYGGLSLVSSTSSTKVYSVAVDNATAVNSTSTIYLATFSINISPDSFGVFANSGIVITSSGYTLSYNQQTTKHSNTIDSFGDGRVVGCWSDNTYNKSVISVVYQYGDVSTVDYSNCIGIAQLTKVSGSLGAYLPLGKTGFANPTGNWIPGRKYYIQTDGTITQDPNGYYIGTAVSYNSINLVGNLSKINQQNVINPNALISQNGISLLTYEPLTRINDGKLYLVDSSNVVITTFGEYTNLKNLVSKRLIIDTNLSSVTVTAGTGAGTSPTVAVETSNSTSSEMAGTIKITTGTTPSGSNAIICTITFTNAYGIAPKVILTPANTASASLSGANQVFIPVANDTNGVTTTSFKIVSGSSALSASTLYKWNYLIIG